MKENLIGELMKMKYSFIIVLLCFGVFAAYGFNGKRLWNTHDVVTAKEESHRSGHYRFHSYYIGSHHK